VSGRQGESNSNSGLDRTTSSSVSVKGWGMILKRQLI
jgi:hypothetical protein